MPDDPDLNAPEPSPSSPADPSPGAESGTSQTGFGAYRARRRAKKALRSKLRRRLTRTAIGVALLIVIVGGGAIGFVYYRLNEIGHVTVNGLTKTRTTGASANAQNILLVGSTDRCAVTPSKNLKNFEQECEDGVNGINSDVIMILHLQPGHTPTLLSIPRDTFVPDARSGGLYNKVDAALYNGPSQLVAAIQQDFGIPINHYIVLNFGNFANIVTELGGITMYFPTSLYDPDSDLYISHSGCLHISGLEALALVRARHMSYDYDRKTKTWRGYDPSGDIGRIERVHIFLKVLAAQVAERGLSNPITDANLLSTLAPNLTVDTTLSTSNMLNLVLNYHAKVSGAPEYTLPIVEDSVIYSYEGYPYGDVVFPTEPQDEQTIKAFLGASSPKAAARSSFTVSVIDGTGSPSATSTTASALRALGYDVTGTASQTSVGPISETTVEYTSGHLADAEAVQRSLSGTVILGEAPTADGADVSVLTGSDLSVASPPVTSTAARVSATTGSSSVLATLMSVMLDSASTTISSPSSALAPATAATSAIPPYDPRACPAKSK